ALLTAGLLVAALADNIVTFILGRALQGTGAVTAVAYAWIADYTPSRMLNRATGIAGLATAVGALAGFVSGPLLNNLLSVAQLFVICAGIAVLNFIYICVAMPNNPRSPVARASFRIAATLRVDGMVWLLAAGFLLNYVLMAVCFVLPLAVDKAIGSRSLWIILVPATAIGILAMLAAARLADRGHFTVLAGASFAAFLPSALCFLSPHPALIAFGTILFMVGYLTLF